MKKTKGIRFTNIDENTLEIYQHKRRRILLAVLFALVLLLYLSYCFQSYPEPMKLLTNKYWLTTAAYVFVAFTLTRNIWMIAREKASILKKKGTTLFVNEDVFESLDYMSHIAIDSITTVKVFTFCSIKLVSKDGKELRLQEGLSMREATKFAKNLNAFLMIKVINDRKTTNNTRPFDAL